MGKEKIRKEVNRRREAYRTCLRCDISFLSASPENRLCAPCREFVNHEPSPATTHRVHITRWRDPGE